MEELRARLQAGTLTAEDTARIDKILAMVKMTKSLQGVAPEGCLAKVNARAIDDTVLYFAAAVNDPDPEFLAAFEELEARFFG